MRRYEYLYRLEQELMGMPEAERKAAMRFYEDYFADAGDENEQQVIEELGTPKELAKKLLSELGGSEAKAAAEDGHVFRAPNGEYVLSGSTKVTDIGDIRELFAEVVNASLKLSRTSEPLPSFEWEVNNENAELRYRLENGRLRIKEKVKNQHVWNWNFSFGGHNDSRNIITIYLPDKCYDEISLETVNGRMEADFITVDTIKLNTVNGKVCSTDISSRRCKCSSVNGKLEISGISVSEDFEGSTVNGKMELSGDFMCNVRLSSVNGAVVFDTAQHVDKYKIKSSSVSGSVRLNGTRIGKRAYGIGGDAVIWNAGAPYTLSASTVSGGVQIETRK